VMSATFGSGLIVSFFLLAGWIFARRENGLSKGPP